jgi:hypothetical protein
MQVPSGSMINQNNVGLRSIELIIEKNRLIAETKEQVEVGLKERL